MKTIEKILLGVTLCLCACTDEQIDNSTRPLGSEVDLSYSATRNASADPETDVNRARLIVCGSHKSFADGERCILNEREDFTPENNTICRKTSTGYRDIFVLINEPETMKRALEALNTIDDVRELRIPFDVNTLTQPTEIPMVKSYWNQFLNGYDIFKEEVERTMVKVSLTLEFTKGGITEEPNVGDVEVLSFNVLNIPTYSYLLPGTYIEDLYQKVIGEKFNKTTTANTDTYKTTFYLPEHIVRNAGAKTYIEVKGKNIKTGEGSTWIISLGAAAATGATKETPYDIARNTHHTITKTIKSYGDVDVSLKVEIAPWGSVTSPNTNGDYIFCNTESLELFPLSNNVGNTVEVPFTCGNYTAFSYRSLFADERIKITYTYDAIAGGKLVVKLNDGYVPTAAVDNDNFEEITLISASYTKIIKIKYVPDLIVLEAPKANIAAINGTITVSCTSKNGNWAFVVKDNAGIEYGRSARVTAKGKQSASLVMEPNIDGAPINYIVSVYDDGNNLETKFNSRLTSRVIHTGGAKLVLVPDGTNEETLMKRGGEGCQLALVSASGEQFDLFFKYGSLIGIDAKRGFDNDTYSSDDLLWSPRKDLTQLSDWRDIPFKDLAPLVNTPENFKAGHGDPCQLVGLTTADISEKNKNGKVTNGTWKRANKKTFTALSDSRINGGFGRFIFQGGADLQVTGYRDIYGDIKLRKSDANNFPHVVYSVYDETAKNGHSHYCSWHIYYSDSYYDKPSGGGVGSTGKDGLVLDPDARNGLPVRCIRSPK